MEYQLTLLDIEYTALAPFGPQVVKSARWSYQTKNDYGTVVSGENSTEFAPPTIESWVSPPDNDQVLEWVEHEGNVSDFLLAQLYPLAPLPSIV